MRTKLELTTLPDGRAVLAIGFHTETGKDWGAEQTFSQADSPAEVADKLARLTARLREYVRLGGGNG